MYGVTKYRKNERCSEMGCDMQRARESGADLLTYTVKSTNVLK